MGAGTSLRGNRQTVLHGTICRLRRGPEKQRHRLWIDPTPFRPLLTPATPPAPRPVRAPTPSAPSETPFKVGGGNNSESV
jgi:hypothetical protein